MHFLINTKIESKNAEHIYTLACGSFWVRPSLLKKSPVSRMVEGLRDLGLRRQIFKNERLLKRIYDLRVSRHSVREKMEEGKPRSLKGGQTPPPTPQTFIEILFIVDIYLFSGVARWNQDI